MMVAKLFHARPPRVHETLLDPGCGTGAFLQGVIRWCEGNGHPTPGLVGIESDPALLEEARRNLTSSTGVQLLQQDFLTPLAERYDYIIGNPPYVPITDLSPEERVAYRQQY